MAVNRKATHTTKKRIVGNMETVQSSSTLPWTRKLRLTTFKFVLLVCSLIFKWQFCNFARVIIQSADFK